MDSIQRIETQSTIWEFNTIEKTYIRIPKSESLAHPMGGKPYEGHQIPYVAIDLLGPPDHDGGQYFAVVNKGIRWGEGAYTKSWAVPGQDLTWVDEEAEEIEDGVLSAFE